MHCSLETRATALNRISQRRIGELLNKIAGLKDFIIDSNLIKPLERIIGVSQLRFHGVDKIFKLDFSNPIPTINSQVVYFIPSDLIIAKRVCDQIHAKLRSTSSNSLSYHIILIPQKLMSIANLFEEEGIIDHVTLYGFQWETIHFDGSVLSLQLESFFRKTFLNQDQLFLPCVARSIWGLHMLYGKPSMTFLQGKYSTLVDRQVDVLYEVYGKPEKELSEIACFLIVDRDIDYPSALLTPGTYTSLLDEVFGIKSGVLDFSLESDKNQMKRLLASSEEIYGQIKHKHFSDVFGFLSKIAKNLQEFKPTANMNLTDLRRNITQKLPNALALKSSLAYHISACEGIIGKMGPRFEGTQLTEQRMLEGRGRKENMAYIEDCIAMKMGNKCSPLRLLCLQSVTQNGLTADEIHSLKVQYLHAYGYKHLTSFHNLDKLGLLTQQSSFLSSEVAAGAIANKVVQAVSLPTRRSTFYSLAQKMKLFPTSKDTYDLKNPKDMGYVFNGAYIPLVCQIVHMLIKREVMPEEVAKMLPNAKVKLEKPSDIAPRTFLVYFVGGVTYSEIAAFYLLEKLTGSQIIVAGTSIVNGNNLIESCL